MIKTLLALLLLTGTALADPAVPAKDYPWPTSAVTVSFGAARIECVWKDGRPMAARTDLVRFLHLPQDGPDPVDLIEAIAEKGWLVRRDQYGQIELVNPNAVSDRPVTVRDSADSKRSIERFAGLLVQNHLQWLKDDPRAATVNAIGQDLARAARRPIPWLFAVIASPEPNAACCGEGIVYVTTGLLDLHLTRDELAGVLAHEVAHGAHQHLEDADNEKRRRQKTVAELNQIEQTYQEAQERARRQYYQDLESGVDPSVASSNREAAVQSARQVYDRSNHYMEDAVKSHLSYAQFSPQTDERQADVIGIRYAVDAGYQADGLLNALEKVAAHNYARYGAVALLGGQTHPPIGERIKVLRDILHR